MSWKKSAYNGLMKFIDDVDKSLKRLETERGRGPLASEEEILKAIEDLPSEPDTPDVKLKTGYQPEDNMVEVRKVPLWSTFKYVGKPEYHGLPKVDSDDRMYFTVPCGWQWDNGGKYWFITFPLGGDENDVTEFFTLMNTA